MSEPLLKTRDVARILGVEMGTVHDYVEAGDLPVIRLRGRVGAPLRFRLSDVEAKLEEWATLGGDNQTPRRRRQRPGADTEEEPLDAPRILRPRPSD